MGKNISRKARVPRPFAQRRTVLPAGSRAGHALRRTGPRRGQHGPRFAGAMAPIPVARASCPWVCAGTKRNRMERNGTERNRSEPSGTTGNHWERNRTVQDGAKTYNSWGVQDLHSKSRESARFLDLARRVVTVFPELSLSRPTGRYPSSVVSRCVCQEAGGIYFSNIPGAACRGPRRAEGASILTAADAICARKRVAMTGPKAASAPSPGEIGISNNSLPSGNARRVCAREEVVGGLPAGLPRLTDSPPWAGRSAARVSASWQAGPVARPCVFPPWRFCLRHRVAVARTVAWAL